MLETRLKKSVWVKFPELILAFLKKQPNLSVILNFITLTIYNDTCTFVLILFWCSTRMEDLFYKTYMFQLEYAVG